MDIMADKNYNTELNKEIYINYITSCINKGLLELIISFKDFLLNIYKQELDEYYDYIYNTYIVNKQDYYEQ
jgi:hypothetical protein